MPYQILNQMSKFCIKSESASSQPFGVTAEQLLLYYFGGNVKQTTRSMPLKSEIISILAAG